MTQGKTGVRRTSLRLRTQSQDGGFGTFKGFMLFGLMLALVVGGMVLHVNFKAQTSDVLRLVQEKEKALKDSEKIYSNRENRIEEFTSEDYIQHKNETMNLGLIKRTQGQVCHIGSERDQNIRRAAASKLASIE